MDIGQIEKIRSKQQKFFSSGSTRDIKFRKEALQQLRDVILRKETALRLALNKDLGKSGFEGYATETGMVLHELRYFLNNLSSLCRPKRVPTPFFAFPSASSVICEPFGQVLIISPWNYPFNLAIIPLIGAVAAGNVVLLRTSGSAPSTGQVVREIVREAFCEEHVAVADCSTSTAEEALKLKWDLIFFTGSPEVGKKVYRLAAENITPVVLELGGKCPVIVEEDAPLKIASRRIIWGKLINSGQTCIAPDYLLVNKNIKDRLIFEMKSAIKDFFGDNPLENPDYPRLVSASALDRILSYTDKEKILFGGRWDREKLKMEPTLLQATFDDRCMKEEIFGPLLPVIEYNNINEAIGSVREFEKPLAISVFSRNRKIMKKVLAETSSGACLFNEVVLHFANARLPFGGVGKSGIGRYHGRESFIAFSNRKAVMSSSCIIDIPLKYPPFGNKEKIIRWFLR